MKLRSLLRTLVDPGWEQSRRRRSPVAAVEVGPLFARRLEERRVLVAPIIIASPAATVFTENGPAVEVDPLILALDADGTLDSVTITIAAYMGPSEELQYTDTANITGSWDGNTGVLTLSGTAAFLEYTTALQSIRYQNTSDAPPATRTITFEGNDGLLFSIPDSKTISIVRNADTPSVTNATTIEDTMSGAGLVIATDPNDGTNFYKITNIIGGALFQNDGTTQINDGDFITLGDGAAGLRFLPTADAFTDPNDVTPFEGRFDVQASTTNGDSGLGGSVVTGTITVDAVADAPNVPNAMTDEDQTATIVITPNAVDGTSVTHFQISNITNGRLFLSDGTTEVLSADFVSVADAAAGLKFMPTPDFFTVTSPLDPATLGSFEVQAVLFNLTQSGPVVQSLITINAVADTPTINNPTVAEEQDATINITSNPVDGSSVTHFKVTGIANGQLYLADGVTQIGDGDFLAVADATGLIFRMGADQFGAGSVDAQGSTTADDSGLSGPTVTSNITVLSVPDDPVVTAPSSVDEDTVAAISIQRSAVDAADVSHFRISNLRHGALFRDAGLTQPVINSDTITAAEAAALFFLPSQDHFSDPMDPATFAGFEVQGSIGAGGTLGSIVTTSIVVNPVAETPVTTDAMMFEDGGQVGIPVAPDSVDGSSVTHFKISAISGGTLRAGATVLSVGDFITVAEGLTLNFEPAADFIGAAEVRFQSAVDANGTGLSPEAVSTISVFSVPDDPLVTAPASVDEDTVAAISIQRSAVDAADVSHFRISNLRHGALYLDAGLTQQVNNGDTITAAEAASLFFEPALDYFSDPLDPATFGGFDVQGSIGVGGTLGSAVTTSIVINTVADTPTINNPTVDEEQDAIINISPNVVDGSSVTHFKITGISNGQLYLADGVTQIGDGDFLAVADATGLIFRMGADQFGAGSLDAQGSTTADDSGLSGPTVTSNITVLSVPDDPVANAPASVDEDTVAAISIQRSAVDAADVSHFRISNLRHGALFRDAGLTQPVNNNDTITAAEAASLFFLPSQDHFSDPMDPATFAGFDVQGSIGAGGTLGSIVTTSIVVNPVADAPQTTDATVDEDAGAVAIRVTPNIVDGSSVTHFKITAISGGTLRAGATVLSVGDFITVAEGLTLNFEPAADFNGTARVRVQAALDAIGTGLSLESISTITVNAVNDRPVIAHPNRVNTQEETSVAISGIVLSDLDMPAGDLELTLQVTHGTLSFVSSAGLDQQPGSTPRRLIYRGTLSELNAALATLSYNPDDNYYSGLVHGLEQLDIRVDDLGQTGSGSGVATARVRIDVDNINDAPRISSPLVPRTVNETVRLTNPIVVRDDDTRPDGRFTVWISATGPLAAPASLRIAKSSDLSFGFGQDDVDGSDFRHFYGTLAGINEALAGLAFRAPDNGLYTVTITLSDDPDPADNIPDGDSRTDFFQVTVNNVSPEAEFGSKPTDAQEGQKLTIQPQTVDVAGKYDPLTFGWRVFYQGALHANGNEGVISFVAGQDGLYSIEFTVFDGDGGRTTITDTLFVSNQIPEVVALKGTPIIRGNTAVRFRIRDAGFESSWRVEIDWGDKQPLQVLIVTSRDVLVTHFYATAPDPTAPFAPINIAITAYDDDSTSLLAQTTLDVIGGLPVPILQFPIDPPRIEVPQVRFVAERPADDSVSELTSEVIERNRQRFNIDETKPRTFELAVVTPDGEELNSYELGQDELWDLESFFKDNQLPDGHYRIYLVQKNTRRLLVDAYLRDGHLIDPGEASGGNFDRPPEVSEKKLDVDVSARRELDEAETRRGELPREFFVNDDDRPRYEAEYEHASAVDGTIVIPIDELPSPDGVQQADEQAIAIKKEAVLVAGLTAGVAGVAWLAARRARKATRFAAPRPHSFSKGAILLRSARRRGSGLVGQRS